MRCEECPLINYCLTQKKDHESCEDMVQRYNNGLLIPLYNIDNSSFK